MRVYDNVSAIRGPLVFVEGATPQYKELVTLRTVDGRERMGQVLVAGEGLAVIEVFEGTTGVSLKGTRTRFEGRGFRVRLSRDMLGFVLDGRGRPRDGDFVAEKVVDVNGRPINPDKRDVPREFIETGVSSIDLLFSLVKGQKLPIFSESGLPHDSLVSMIARGARRVVIVLGLMGVTRDDLYYYKNELEKEGALERMVVVANLSDDPVVERIVTPRVALSIGEFFAWDHGMDVLVVLVDMTKYCEALREVSAAKEEVPSRRGYPPYLYSDLASIYERAGRIRGREGSITQVPVLTMPEGDITHPVPDLTGYITEGQIILSPGVYNKGVFPPVDIIPSLSRMMHNGVGEGFTRRDHPMVANQVYALYARGKRIEKLKTIVGEESLSREDRMILSFTDRVERELLHQDAPRSLEETLAIAWCLLSSLPRELLTKIEPDVLDKYYKPQREESVREE